MLGTRIKKLEAGLFQSQGCFCTSEPLSGTHIRSHVPGEEGGILGGFFERGRGRGCVNLCTAPVSVFFFFLSFFPNGLKGLVFFLADKQKTALCVSVISLPGLAAKLASAAPSVELAPRSQCHTERAAFQTTKKTGCVSVRLCADDSMQCFFFLPLVSLCSFSLVDFTAPA